MTEFDRRGRRIMHKDPFVKRALRGAGRDEGFLQFERRYAWQAEAHKRMFVYNAHPFNEEWLSAPLWWWKEPPPPLPDDSSLDAGALGVMCAGFHLFPELLVEGDEDGVSLCLHAVFYREDGAGAVLLDNAPERGHDLRNIAVKQFRLRDARGRSTATVVGLASVAVFGAVVTSGGLPRFGPKLAPRSRVALCVPIRQPWVLPRSRGRHSRSVGAFGSTAGRCA